MHVRCVSNLRGFLVGYRFLAAICGKCDMGMRRTVGRRARILVHLLHSRHVNFGLLI